MASGKYKRKLNTNFIMVFTLLISIFLVIFMSVVLDYQSDVYNDAVIQSAKSSLSNSQLKYEIVNNTHYNKG